MAELPRTFTTPRQPTAVQGAPVGRQQLPQTPATPLSAGLGAGLREAGGLVSDLGQAFGDAEVLVDAGDAVRQVNRLISDARVGIEQRREKPRTFVQQFRAATDQQIQTVLDSLSPRARRAAQGQINSALSNAENQLRDRGNQQFLQQAGQTLKDTMAMYADNFSQADDPVRRQEVRAEAAEFLDGAVATGLITSAGRERALQQFTQQTAMTDMAFLIETNPKLAAMQLQQGVDANPDIPAREIPGLLQRSMQRMDTMLTRQERLASIQDRNLAKRQSATASEVRMELYAPEATVSGLLGMQDRINTLRAQNRISEEDHAEFLRTVDTRMVKLNGDLQNDNEEQLARELSIRIHTANSGQQVQEIRQDIIEQQASLSFGDTSRLLGQIERQLDATYFANSPQYKEGARIILSGAFPAGIVAATFDRLDSASQTKLNAALEVYRDTFAAIGDIREVNRRAVDVAREIRRAYFPVATVTTNPVLPPELDPAKRAFGEVVRDLNRMDIPETLKDQYFEAIEMKQNAFVEGTTAAAENIETEIRATQTPGFFQRMFGTSEANQ